MMEGSVIPALHPILLVFCPLRAATTAARNTMVTLNSEIDKSNPALSQIKCRFELLLATRHLIFAKVRQF